MGIKKGVYKSAYVFYEGRELTLDAFKNGILPIKATNGEEILNKWFKNNQ